MYAVFSTGSKQYKVRKGDTIKVEVLPEACGITRSFAEVLLVGEGNELNIGAPFLSSASVSAEILSHDRGEKLFPFQKKRRKQHRRKIGHRQLFTRLLITGIEDGAGKSEMLNADEKKTILGRVGFRLGDHSEEVEETEEATAAPRKTKRIAKAKVEAPAAEKPKAKKASGTKKPAAKKVTKKK